MKQSKGKDVDIDKKLPPQRKFIRYSESYDFYGISPHKLRDIAESCGAIYKPEEGTVMISCAILDEYLEGFRQDPKDSVS